MVQINTNSPGLCPLGVLDPLNVPCTLSQLTWRFQPFRISFKQVRVCRSIFMLMLSLLFTFICMFTDFKERRDMWKMTFLDSQVLFSLIFATRGKPTHESTLKTKYMMKNDNNSTQNAPKSIILGRIKKSMTFPIIWQCQIKIKSTFQKVTFLDSRVLFFTDCWPRRET